MANWNKIYKDWAEQTIEEIRKTLSKYPSNRGKGSGLRDSEFLKDITYKVSGGNVQLEYPSYGVWIDRGRGANKTPPPVKAIIPWMDRKGISNYSPFAVAKNIGKFGIARRPWLQILDEQLYDLDEIIADELEKELLEK
jgi:hypothetical protein